MKRPSRLPLIALALLPAALSATNLILNGDFENGLNDWNLLAQDGASASYAGVTDTAEGTGALRATVDTLGSNPWSVQVFSADWAANLGQSYTLTYWAKAATAGRSIHLVIQDQSYGNQQSFDQALTTAWTQYSWTFSPGAASMDFVIQFTQTGTFWIDDIRLDDGVTELPAANLVLDASERHQEMVGFGGGLTWYANRVLSSPQTDAIQQLIFEDLGADILRFQNWYFPPNYPANKDATGMPDQTTFAATNTFYSLAKAANPEVKILLSSWGPPAALKSNGATAGGTLKKENGAFIYDQYVQYWVDSLDHLGFVPDYLSMQNEPGYTNTWTTCQWRPTETADFPGYLTAFDLLHEAIKDRPQVPLMIGPEAENIGPASWDNALNTFREFSAPLQGRDYLAGYAYHLYNIYNSGRIDGVNNELHIIRDEFGEKPNFMTEYSQGFAGWLETARIIQNTLVEANASAYIHWNLVWATGTPDAMITISTAGDYTVQENYYALKHFAKFIDLGFRRVTLGGSDQTLRASAFLSPNGRRLVIVVVNSNSNDRTANWDLPGADIASVTAVRTTAAAMYADLGTVILGTAETIPAESVTTYVVDLNRSLLPVTDPVVLRKTVVAPTAGPITLTVENLDGVTFSLWKSHDLDGTWSEVTAAVITPGAATTTLQDPTPGSLPVFYEVRARY